MFNPGSRHSLKVLACLCISIINALIRCPNMVINLSMYVDLHYVYPAMNVNFSILKGSENDRYLQFHNFGRKYA